MSPGRFPKAPLPFMSRAYQLRASIRPPGAVYVALAEEIGGSVPPLDADPVAHPPRRGRASTASRSRIAVAHPSDQGLRGPGTSPHGKRGQARLNP